MWCQVVKNMVSEDLWDSSEPSRSKIMKQNIKTRVNTSRMMQESKRKLTSPFLEILKAFDLLESHPR